MRLKRNYLGAIKRKLDWFFSRFKPLTVHTEAIVIDSVWKKIQVEVKKGDIFKWYVMTPTNADYFKSEFNINVSRSSLSKILKERYGWMVKQGVRLELHMHLSMVMNNISYKEQEKMFKESLGWMKKELGIIPKEFVPGWWSFNEDTLKLCKKYGLKIVHERDYDYIHDFDLID